MVQAESLSFLINRRSNPEQVQRGHQNSLETLPLFLVQMMFVGLVYPLTCAIFGIIW